MRLMDQVIPIIKNRFFEYTTSDLDNLTIDDFNEALRFVFTKIEMKQSPSGVVYIFGNEEYAIKIVEDNSLMARVKISNILRAMYPSEKLGAIDLRLLKGYATTE